MVYLDKDGVLFSDAQCREIDTLREVKQRAALLRIDGEALMREAFQAGSQPEAEALVEAALEAFTRSHNLFAYYAELVQN